MLSSTLISVSVLMMCTSCCLALVLQQCSEFTFRCRNGRCISKLNPECDEERDCEDGSDEDNCRTSPTQKDNS